MDFFNQTNNRTKAKTEKLIDYRELPQKYVDDLTSSDREENTYRNKK